MTLNQFLAELRSVRGFAAFGSERALRRLRRGQEECPIVAVANRRYRRRRFPDEDYVPAAEYLGLDLNLADRIAYVADGLASRSRALRKLHAALLKAVGL